MMMEVNRNLHMLAVFRYPWLRNIPEDWPNLVHFFEGYKPILVPKVIHWKPPMEGTYKCNSDGASKGNPGQSAGGFCIRDWKGEFIFAATYDLGIRTGLEAETSAMEKGLNYCVTHNLLPVCLETDSLVLTKILNGVWEVPWSIKIQIQKIELLRNNREVQKIKLSNQFKMLSQAEERKEIPNRYTWTLDPSFLDSGISSLGAQSVKRRRSKENGFLQGTDIWRKLQRRLICTAV
ncbi:hypothetical protein KY289_035905 [Solanum tuberosum]|nr:hypothetical protein KY289_035905 [Solanum tuberosum]